MRLTIVTDTYAPEANGVANCLERLAGGLTADGHSVSVVCPRFRNRESAPGTVAVRSFPVPGYAGVRLGVPSYRALRGAWSREAPDIVYVATETPLGASAVKAARSAGVPVVSGYHTQFHQYAGKYGLHALSRPVEHYLRKLHNRTACTFAPAEDVRQQLLAAGYNEVRLLGRGVDTLTFSPTHRSETLRRGWGAAPGDPVFLVVGRVAPEKNIPLAVRAFEAARVSAPGARLVVVGAGPARRGLEAAYPGAVWTGEKRGAELARIYASADIFLFPSLTETFGNVLLEAMASGLDTVSFRYAASLAHARHGENGRQAEPGDEGGFIYQAKLAAEDHRPAGRAGHALRAAARKTAQGVTWTSVARRFEGDLTELIARWRVSESIHSHDRATVPAILPDPMIPTRKPSILRFKTLFLSDVHLGTPDSKIEEVNDFLRRTRCEKLVLNGDIIDGWHLRRNLGNWSAAHTHFVRIVLAKIEKEGTEVVYLRGNHDDILERFLPIQIANLSVVSEHVHQTPHGRYLVVHGDGFDQVTTHYRWVAVAGAVGYEALLKLNRVYNRWRRLIGKPEYSLSKAVKAKVKSAVSFIGRYEEQLVQLAGRRGCDGIICGHIHSPADKRLDGVHYLNSGDWVESLTAVVETLDRQLKVLTYDEFIATAGTPPAPGATLPQGTQDPRVAA